MHIRRSADYRGESNFGTLVHGTPGVPAAIGLGALLSQLLCQDCGFPIEREGQRDGTQSGRGGTWGFRAAQRNALAGWMLVEIFCVCCAMISCSSIAGSLD